LQSRIPVGECILHVYWIHSYEGSLYLEYCNSININSMRCNFYYFVYLDILVKYCKNIFGNMKIDGMVNCLASFNLNETLKDQEDAE